MDQPNWCRSHFPEMWLKHKSIYNRCYRLNFKFLIGYSESPRKIDPDDIWTIPIGADDILNFFFWLTLFVCHNCCHTGVSSSTLIWYGTGTRKPDPGSLLDFDHDAISTIPFRAGLKVSFLRHPGFILPILV